MNHITSWETSTIDAPHPRQGKTQRWLSSDLRACFFGAWAPAFEGIKKKIKQERKGENVIQEATNESVDAKALHEPTTVTVVWWERGGIINQNIGNPSYGVFWRILLSVTWAMWTAAAKLAFPWIGTPCRDDRILPMSSVGLTSSSGPFPAMVRTPTWWGKPRIVTVLKCGFETYETEKALKSLTLSKCRFDYYQQFSIQNQTAFQKDIAVCYFNASDIGTKNVQPPSLRCRISVRIQKHL